MPDYWQNLVFDRDALVDDRRRVEAITDDYLGLRDEEDRRRGDDAAEVLTRIMRVEAAEATRRLAEWQAAPLEIDAVPVPPGIVARERVRRDTRPGHGGQPALRRQRIAVAAGEQTSWVAYWSAPEPVTAAHERPWQRAIARLSGADDDRGGWSA